MRRSRVSPRCGAGRPRPRAPRPPACRPPGSAWRSWAAALPCSWPRPGRRRASWPDRARPTPSRRPKPRRRRYDVVVLLTRSGTTTEMLDYARGLAGDDPHGGRDGHAGQPDRRALRRHRAARLRRRALGRADALRHDRPRAGARRPGRRHRRPGRCRRGRARPSRCRSTPAAVAPVRLSRARHGRRGGARGRAQAARGGRRSGPRPIPRPSSATGRSARSAPPAWCGPSARRPPARPRRCGPPAPPSGRPAATPWSSSSWRSAWPSSLAQGKGLDPDHPRHLTRSVILPSDHQGGRRETQ